MEHDLENTHSFKTVNGFMSEVRRILDDERIEETSALLTLYHDLAPQQRGKFVMALIVELGVTHMQLKDEKKAYQKLFDANYSR